MAQNIFFQYDFFDTFIYRIKSLSDILKYSKNITAPSHGSAEVDYKLLELSKLCAQIRMNSNIFLDSCEKNLESVNNLYLQIENWIAEQQINI